MSEKIKVGIKVRPLIAREKDSDKHWIVVNDGLQQVEPVSLKPRGDAYIFDHVFTPDSTNREVFEILVKPIVQSAVRGFNGTIFAYGQTSSGKTYTMMGDKYEPGIIPLAVDYMFKEIENSRGREYLLRVAYLEIYNERINDLLKKGQVNLKVSEDSFGNVVVKDLTEDIVNTPQMCMDFMKKGEQIRKIGETNMNDRSSRSHTIFRVIIESREAGSGADDVINVSHLNLVDLAGSERAGATGAVGERLKEGCAINKSLFMLSHVISKLSDGEPFVNFRDSRLTRILQSSLGGNALTAIICAVTPASSEETLSTLGFASRAKNIKNTAQVNEVVSDAALLKRYARQINKLKSELEEAKQGKNGPCVQEMESKLQEQEERNRQLQERLDFLKEKLIVSNGNGSDTTADEQRMKTLRRRTWTAPSSLKKGRSSLQAFTSPTSFLTVPGELLNMSMSSTKSSLSSVSEFGMPLEEFEKDLLRRCRSPVLLEEEEENEEPLRLDSRFVSTRRGRSSVRSSDDWEPKPMEGNCTPSSVLNKVVRQTTDGSEDQNVNIFAEDYGRLKEEHERLKKEIEVERETAQAAIVSLEETVQKQTGRIERLKAESAELALQVKSEEGAAQAGVSLAVTVQKQASQIESLKSEKEELVAQMKSLKSEDAEFVARIESLEAEKEELVAQMKSLKSEDAEFVARIESLEAENKEFLTQINNLRAENEKFVAQLRCLKAEEEELATQARTEVADERAKITSLEDLISNQADQIRSLVAENESLLLKITSDKEDGEATISSLVGTVKALENELEASRSFKSSSFVIGEETPKTKLLRFATEELNELKDFTRLEKQTHNEELEKTVNRLQKELVDQVKAESELKSKLDLLTERCFKLEKIKEEFNVVRQGNLTEADLKVLLMDSNKTVAQLTDANKELQSEVEELNKQLKNSEALHMELRTLRKNLDEIKQLHQESEKTLKSQLARIKDLEEERSDFDLKMDVIKKQFARREQELTASLEEAWDKLKVYESGDTVDGNEALLRKEVEKLKAENAKFANQNEIDREERAKMTETVSTLERQLAASEDGAKEIVRLEAEMRKYDNRIEVDQEERIKELTETVSSLERQLSIFRSSDVTRKGRLSALYVLEEEPSIGELSDEVYGLRTENKQYKLRISDLEELKDEYQQQITTLRQELESARAPVKYSSKAVDVSRDNVSYSECDITLQREDCERAVLFAEIEELKRISNVKTEENLELRAALERMSKEVAEQEKVAEVLNRSFINKSVSAEALTTSFIDESNSAEAEEYVTCTDDTLATTSKSSSSLFGLDKINPEDEELAKLQSVDADQGRIDGEVSFTRVEDKPCEVICTKRKHESAKDDPERSFKIEYEGDILNDISIPPSCDISLVDETATPDYQAKRRRVSSKFAASPRYQQDSPIEEASSFEELKEANSCLEAELNLKNERISVLMEEIKGAHNQLDGLFCAEREKERLQQVLEDKDKHIADVEAEVLELRASQGDARKLKEDLAILESTILIKNGVIQELEAKTAMIEAELRRQSTDDEVPSYKLREELCELESMLNVKSERIASIERVITELEAEVTTLRLVADEATKLREDLAMSKTSCESKKGVILRFEEEITALREELGRFQGDFSARSDLVSKTSDPEEEGAPAMREELGLLQEKLTSLTNVQPEKDLVEGKSAGLQEERVKATGFEEERKQLLGEVACLREKNATTDALAEERDRLGSEVVILQKQIATIEALTEERDRLVDERARLQETVATFEVLKEERDRLAGEATTLHDKIAELESLKEDRDRLAEEATTLHNEIAELENLKEDRDRLAEEATTLHDKFAELESLKEDRDRLAEEATTLHNEIAELESLKEDRDRLAEEATSLHNKIAELESLKEERDRLAEEATSLHNKIAELESLKEERDRLAEEATTLHDKIAELESLKEDRDRLAEEATSLHNKIDELETLKEDRDRLAGEATTLHDKIAELESLKEERDRLAGEATTLQDKTAEIESLKEERDRLVDEMASLQEKVATFEILKDEKARLLEEIMELRLNLPNSLHPHEDVLHLEEQNNSKLRRTILLERENALLKERLSVSEKTPDELGKDFDADQWEDQIISVRRQIVSLQENVALDVLKQEKERLEEKLAKESAKVAQVEADFKKTSSILEILKEDDKNKAKKIEELEEKIAHIRASQTIPSDSEEISSLHDQLRIKTEKIAVIEQQLEEAQDKCLEISKLREDLAFIEKEHSSKTDRVRCLEGELASLRDHLDQVQDEPKDQTVSKEMSSLQEDVLSLRHRISFLGGVTVENERLEKEVEENLAQISKLKAELSELRVVSLNKTSLREELAMLEEECSVKNNKLASLEADVLGFKSELVRYEGETNAQKELISKIGEDIEAKQKTIVEFKEKMSAFAEEKECLQRALDEKIEEITQLRSEMAELKIVAMDTANLNEDSAEAQQSDLKCAKEDLCHKEREISSLKEDLSLRERDLISAKEELFHQESKLKSTEEDLWQKERELKSMQEDLWQKERELTLVKEDLCHKESDMKFMQEDLWQKERELTSVKEDLWQKDTDLKSMQEDLCQEKSQMKSVKEDLCQKERELKSMQEDLCQKERELTSVKEVLWQKSTDLKSIQEDLCQKERELTSVKEDLCQKDRELTSVKEDLCQKDRELTSVKEDLSQKEDEIESVKNGANTMEVSYKTLKEELNEREGKILELESEIRTLETKSSTVVLLAEEKRRFEEQLEWARGEKERLKEELQLKIGSIAQFEVEASELHMKAADAVKLQDQLQRELILKNDELTAKEDELQSLKIEINRLSPFENLIKALKSELNESKKKVLELESELVETRESVAVFVAGKEEKNNLVKELETKSKELEDQVIMVKFLEDRIQSKKTDFDIEKIQLKKTMAAQMEKYAKENETLKGEVESARKFVKEQIESADPEIVCADNDDIEDLVACLITAVKKSKAKHFMELKEKFKIHLTELTGKLKRSEANEKEIRQRLEDTEITLKKYKDEVRKIGDLEKTLTAMSDRTKKFQSDLESARKAEESCLRRLQELSCVPDECVDTCLRRIEELLLAKADKQSQMANETSILEVRRLKIELSEKEETNHKLSTKVAELTSRCEECTVKISSLERLLSDAQKKTADLAPEAQTKILLSKLSAKESLIEELHQMLREEQSKTWLKSPMRGSYSAAEDQYKQRVEMLSKELKTQTQLAESLAVSLEEQRRLYCESVSKAVVAAERKETTRLKEECEQLKDQLSTVSKTVESLQNEKRALATQLAEVRLKLQVGNNSSDGKSLTVQNTVDSFADSESLPLKQQVKDLLEELQKKNAEIEELKEKVKELDWECEEVASELRKTRTLEEKLYEEKEETAKTVKALQQVEQDLNEALTQKQQELNAALSELKERKGNEKSQKSKTSPLVPKGQLWHSTERHRPSTSTQKDGINLLSSKNAMTENVPEGCQCESLRQQIKALRFDLSDAKGRNVELEMELKRQNYPFKKKIETLESEVKYLKNANSDLRADNRRLLNTYADTTVQDCEACRMRLHNMKSVEVQTETVEVRDLWLSGKTSGIVEEGNRVMLEDKVRKLQHENAMLVTLSKERLKLIKDYQEQLKQYTRCGNSQ